MQVNKQGIFIWAHPQIPTWGIIPCGECRTERTQNSGEGWEMAPPSPNTTRGHLPGEGLGNGAPISKYDGGHLWEIAPISKYDTGSSPGGGVGNGA